MCGAESASAGAGASQAVGTPEMVTPETLKLMVLLVKDGFVDEHVVDGGFVDEHVVVVLVDDHEVVAVAGTAGSGCWTRRRARSGCARRWPRNSCRSARKFRSQRAVVGRLCGRWLLRTLVTVNAGCCERWLL
jgi:hypothetical protein